MTDIHDTRFPDEAAFPLYLHAVPASSHTYGTLTYNRRSKCWVIKAEPCVTELAKRLFPGCEGSGRGEARFTAHRRIIGDLNWLMLRYPLEIKSTDRARWQEALEAARAYATHRDQLLRAPERTQPPAASFSGTLLDFQQQGLSFLIHARRCLLADDMGLGKTVQALAFLATSRAYPAVIVMPPHLTRNWLSEIARFLNPSGSMRIHVIKGLTPYPLPSADIYLIHYLLLRGWKEVLPHQGFQTVIFDEIQELRRGTSSKYSAASLLAQTSANCIGLSGTPIYNNGGEIWNVVNIIDYQFLGSWESFTREWCYAYNSAIVAKPELLGSHLRREGLMLRRLKSEVLPQLAPKRRLVQEIDWDDRLYREMMKPALEQLHLLKTTSDPAQRSLIEEALSQRERQATGMAKAPYVSAFVSSLLEAGERVLLLAHHHSVMAYYAQSLKAHSPSFITGRESASEKARAEARFTRGQTQLLCLSLRTASGLNLPQATCVVFGELDWSPAVHTQAEDRAHRLGSQDSLLCYYLVSPRGSDRDMQDALGLKVSQFVSLMGDEPSDQQDMLMQQSYAREHIRKLVERLSKEAEEQKI